MGWQTAEDRARREEWRRQRDRRREMIRELFEAGKSDHEIANHLRVNGYPKATVLTTVRIRVKMGLRRPPAKPPVRESLVDLDLARQHFEERKPKSREEIANLIEGLANDMGCDPKHMRRVLRNAGVVERVRVGPDPAALKRAEALLDDGMPYALVAKVTGVSYDSLKNHLPGRGVRPEDMGAYRAAKRLEEKVGL